MVVSKNEEVAILKQEIALLKQEFDEFKKTALEREISTVFESASDAIILYKKDGSIVAANQAFSRITNIPLEEMKGRSLKDFIPKEKRYKLKRIQTIIEHTGKAKGILPIQHSEGTFYFETVVSNNERMDWNLAIMRDVTHKRILEQKVRKNEHLFQELFLEALDGIIFWDTKGRIINANSAACRILECGYSDLIERHFMDLPIKTEKNRSLYKIMAEFKSSGAVRDELYFKVQDGREKLLEFTCRMHSIDGFHMTIFRDITERNKMEKELRESEQIFRIIFEEALDGIILWNEHFEIMDINSSAVGMLGLKKEQMAGQSLVELVSHCSVKKEDLLKHVDLVIQNGKDASSIYLNTYDGEKRHIEFSTQHALVAGLNVTVFKDVSERIQMEEQLRKSDTLNVLGELAAGIAHEIRNPMTALKGFIQLLEGSIKEENTMYYQVITSELQRIDSIINEFLILAKPQAVRFQEKDVVGIMQKTVELLNAQAVLHNVQFELEPDAELPPIFCEPNQLKKVFINIIKNAIEVMPNGGTISIEIKQQEDMVLISIKDQGAGIPVEKIKRLGEPFYTTKERGTGLGLMVSFKIIEEHRGKVEIESEMGKGTTFLISLPIKPAKGKK